MGGNADGPPDEDYKQFMSELGMGPQSSGRPGGGGGDSFSRPHPGLGLERWISSSWAHGLTSFPISMTITSADGPCSC